ncbi:MAG: hypothetical protein KIT16_17215 [Rhodospirillaceae bacterium]|nr:hypothetical protein [Rhodospirillaceae bacterium]
MRHWRMGMAAIVLVAAGPAQAAELLRIPLRPNVEIRAAVEPPSGRAVAFALLFAGGNGKIELDDRGQPQSLRGNFLIRARHYLRDRGIGVVMVDAPSDYQGEEGLWPYRLNVMYAGDIGQVVNRVKKRFRRPVWLVGTSAGTLSIAVATAHLSYDNRPDGIVFTSSYTRPTRRHPLSVFNMSLASYNGPALVVAHSDDGCMATPPSDAPRLLAALGAARPKKFVTISGGSPARSGPCQGRSQHGFFGVEAQAMGAVADFILHPAP